MIGSKEEPAALDAYKTADSDEPTFTLQGGDPLGAPLVRLWAVLARVRTGIATKALVTDVAGELAILAAERDSVEHDQREAEELLLRATAAEQVSWAMDSYRKGDRRGAAETPVEKILDTQAAIDLHEARRKAADELSHMFSDLNIMREELLKLGAEENLDGIMREAISLLRSIYNKVQPSEVKKLNDPANW